MSNMVLSVTPTPVQSPTEKVEDDAGVPNESQSRALIDYPRRRPFERYVERRVNPEIQDVKPTLVKREQADYLKIPETHGNPYKFIRFERIAQLKNREIRHKEDDERRCQGTKTVAEKLPFALRQRHTAASNLRHLIHEENLKEVQKYGRLFPPNDLTNQPVNSKYNQLGRVPQPQSSTVGAHLLSTHGTESDADNRQLSDEARSFEADTESKEQFSRIDGDLQGSIRMTTDSEMDKVTGSQVIDVSPKAKRYEGIKEFLEDRRRVCLLELATRTKRGETNRLDAIVQAEVDFLGREEQELLRKHDQHDRYLKSICQRTAEAIRLAEGEAGKRNDITERIKRARYKLAHLNAECVKLEEEYLRLSTYKDFLRRVAETFREHHHEMKRSESLEIERRDGGGASGEQEGKDTIAADPNDSEQVEKISQMTEDGVEVVPLLNFFTSPQDLVDILSELESNNLTLIENVQEQEEVCERVRAKAAKLYNLLNVERTIVDNHINRENQNILTIKDNVNSIGTARSALTDFVLLERYIKVFSLGDLSQFDTNDCDHAGQTSSGTARKVTVNNKDSTGKQTRLTFPLHHQYEDARPTISTLLSVLQIHIQKVYSAVYGTNEGGARLDTLVMLRRLETTVDELSEMITAYPRNLVLKAKRTVDERDRVNSRRRQKFESQLAYEKRLQKAIQKAREAPRWRYGRRILERSKPPEVKRILHIGAATVESDEEKRSLFQ